jgi:hypothetical protein
MADVNNLVTTEISYNSSFYNSSSYNSSSHNDSQPLSGNLTELRNDTDGNDTHYRANVDDPLYAQCIGDFHEMYWPTIMAGVVIFISNFLVIFSVVSYKVGR